MDSLPSEKAIEACYASDGDLKRNEIRYFAAPETYLYIAHDPTLGLDRSVRLGDVVEALRDGVLLYGRYNAASYIERKFGGKP